MPRAMEAFLLFWRRLAPAGVFLLAGAAASTGPKANSDAAGHAASGAEAHTHLGLLASDLNECATQANSCLEDVE